MKKQVKLFIALLSVLVALFALAMVSSATEYTVKSNDEFNTAFASASDGDTIIIQGDISTTLSFRKSITYILEADWSCGSGEAPELNGGDKSVSLYAKGGTYSFKINNVHWCNDYSNAPFVNNCITWSFGGLDGGILNVDLQGCANRIFHQSGSNVNDSEDYNVIYNLYSGARVINGGVTENNNNNTRFFIGKEFNMYDGSYFVGNKATQWTPIIDVVTLNMYGGEIAYNYGNAGNGSIQVNNLNMYGGKIHNNYQGWNNNVITGFINVGALKMYGGEIYNNYSAYRSNNTTVIGEYGVSRGSFYFKDDSVIYNNYVVDSMTILRNEDTGLYYLESTPAPRADSIVYKNRTVHNFSYSLIFGNKDASVINAYMVNGDGTVLTSVDGSDTVAIPSGISAWTSTVGGCKTVAVSTNAQGTYYVASEHTITGEKDCTKGVVCNKCETSLIEPQPSHKLSVTIVYNNYNFAEAGTKTEICQNPDCEYNVVTEAPALFGFVGYSVNDDLTELCARYTVNVKAISEYNTCNPTVKIQYGVLAAANFDSTDVLKLNGDKIEANNCDAIIADVANEFIGFDFRLGGFFNPTTAEERNLKAESLVLCAYVVVNDDIYYVSAIGENTYFEKTALSLTFYDVSKETPPTFE